MVAGVEDFGVFLREVLPRPEYGLTDQGSDLHATLWRYYDEEKDGPTSKEAARAPRRSA